MAVEQHKELLLSLGTNIGDREKNITEAIEKLSLRFGNPTALSDIIESEAWGYESDNRYLNCAIMFSVALPPTAILDITEQIERELGRTQKSIGGVYCDRPIDIDILFYGNECINSSRLTIPHPLLHQRMFVLEPLAQIVPHFIHPLLNKSVEELLCNIKQAHRHD